MPLYFFKILIFRIVRGAKVQKWPEMTENSVSHFIEGTVPHMIVVFGTHV